MILYSSAQIITWYIDNKENEKIIGEISNSITVDDIESNEVEEKQYNIDFKSLKETNNDVIAFLSVKGTNIENVIVKGNNNEYYLNHSLDRSYNQAGWTFADYRNKLNGTDKNIVIYGHNRRDGSMFGTLKNILQEEWYNEEENLEITFITENESYVYQVFSVYQIKEEEYYTTTEFSKNEYADFIKVIKTRSIKDFGVQVTSEDSILTLSTCANDNRYRTVLHAKQQNKN